MNMDLSQLEVKKLSNMMTTQNYTPMGNVIWIQKYGNSKIIVRDNYINENNIKFFETTLENLYTNVKITITKKV